MKNLYSEENNLRCCLILRGKMWRVAWKIVLGDFCTVAFVGQNFENMPQWLGISYIRPFFFLSENLFVVSKQPLITYYRVDWLQDNQQREFSKLRLVQMRKVSLSSNISWLAACLRILTLVRTFQLYLQTLLATAPCLLNLKNVFWR